MKERGLDPHISKTKNDKSNFKLEKKQMKIYGTYKNMEEEAKEANPLLLPETKNNNSRRVPPLSRKDTNESSLKRNER